MEADEVHVETGYIAVMEGTLLGYLAWSRDLSDEERRTVEALYSEEGMNVEHHWGDAGSELARALEEDARVMARIFGGDDNP